MLLSYVRRVYQLLSLTFVGERLPQGLCFNKGIWKAHYGQCSHKQESPWFAVISFFLSANMLVPLVGIIVKRKDLNTIFLDIFTCTVVLAKNFYQTIDSFIIVQEQKKCLTYSHFYIMQSTKNRYLKIRFKIEFNCAIKINENKMDKMQ